MNYDKVRFALLREINSEIRMAKKEEFDPEELDSDAKDFWEEFGDDALDIVKEMGFDMDDIRDFQDESDHFKLTVGSEDWIGFNDDEDAESYAVERVKGDMESEPEMFTGSFMERFITISPTDKRMMAADMANARTDGLSDEDALRDADMQDDYDEKQEEIDDLESEIEELEEEITELDEELEGLDEEDQDMQEHQHAAIKDEIEGKNDEISEKRDLISDVEKEMESMPDDAKEKIEEEIADEWEKGLEDPIDFLVNEQGLYSIEDLMESSFINIDTEEAAEAAVDEDGVAHFLAQYDGRQLDVGATVWFRT